MILVPLAAIREAADAGKYLFMFFSKSEDDQTLAMRKVFEKAMEKTTDRAKTLVVNITDSSEKAIVAKFDLTRAPMCMLNSRRQESFVSSCRRKISTADVPQRVGIQLLTSPSF